MNWCKKRKMIQDDTSSDGEVKPVGGSEEGRLSPSDFELESDDDNRPLSRAPKKIDKRQRSF
jgi:hypothetical protein